MPVKRNNISQHPPGIAKVHRGEQLIYSKDVFDVDALAFVTATGITDETQKNAINQLVIDLLSTRAEQYALTAQTRTQISRIPVLSPFPDLNLRFCRGFNAKHLI